MRAFKSEIVGTVTAEDLCENPWAVEAVCAVLREELGLPTDYVFWLGRDPAQRVITIERVEYGEGQTSA